MTDPAPFDRHAVRLHRDRAAATVGTVADILRDAAERLLDRLDDTTRRFTRALDVGGRGVVAPLLRARGIEVVSFDLVVANLSLHWVNDLPGALIQLRQALELDGLLLASFPALGTLGELRAALTATEAELTGGASPRISPFPDLRDLAGLLQRAGYALPVADVESIVVAYADPFALLQDLRAAGEANAVALRDRRTPPDLFPTALAALPDHGGRVPATLRMGTVTGWAPGPQQPQPLKPGSGRVSLSDALRG